VSRRARTGLSIRFLRANRTRDGLLTIVIAATVAGVVVIGHVGETAVLRADAAAQSQYGEATVRLPAGDETTIVGAGGWITRDQMEQIGSILAVESVTVSPGIEAGAFVLSGDEFIPALVLAGDGDLDPPTTASQLMPQEIDAVLIGTAGPAGSAKGFLDLAEADLIWLAPVGTEGSGSEWVLRTSARELLRWLRDGGIAPADAVGNRLVISNASTAMETEAVSPAVIAYNAVELLAPAFPGISVLSRTDQAGRSTLVSARNIALLVQLALILPALAAVVGSALVTAESRGDQVALLRTLGFTSSAIRRIFVREFFLVSTGATAVGLVVGVGILAGLSPVGILAFELTSVPVVPVALCSAIIPPGLALLSLRRFSAKPLHEQLAESRR